MDFLQCLAKGIGEVCKSTGVWISQNIIPIADIIISSVITIIGIIISIVSSEKSSRKILYASAKPLVYFLEKKPNASNIRTVTFKSDLDGMSVEFTSYTKNSDNGIAIIKRITLGNTAYYPTQECFIEKGEIVKIVIDAINAPPSGTIELYDIYNHSYPITFKVQFNYFEKTLLQHP